MRITNRNLIDSLESSSITVIASVTGYPYTNLQDQRLSTEWHSNTTSVQTIIIDFGLTTAITTAAILNHNIVNGTTIKVEANATNVWTSPSLSETLTWNEDIILKFFASASYRYWRFYIAQGSLEIGRIWLGTYITINPSSLLDFSITYKNSDVNFYGMRRQKFSSAGNIWKSFSLNFPTTEAAMISTINTWIDTVGKYTSVIFCNFDTIRDYVIVEPCYCSLISDVGFTHSERLKFSYSLLLEEDK